MQKKKQQKQKQKPKTTALVLYKPNTKPQKQKKKSVTKDAGGDLVAYKAALSQPFSLSASNARVPDMYSCPTATRRITRSITLSTNASGDADFIVLPSAFMHAFNTIGTFTSSVNVAAGSGAVYSSLSTAPNALASQLTNYRIVGYGVKILGVQSEQLAAGKLQAATLPISTWVNGVSAIGGQLASRSDPAQTVGAWLTALGIPNTSNLTNITAIPTLTNSVITPVTRLNEVPMQVIPKITSPEAFSFRQSDDSTIGFSLNDQTSTAFVTGGDSSYLRLGGHEAVLVTLSGCAASTPVVEIELVYHLEGMAAPSTITGIQQSTERVTVNPIGWMNVVQQVAKLPAFRSAVESAGNAIIPGMGTLANRLL